VLAVAGACIGSEDFRADVTVFSSGLISVWGTAVAQWLRYCATNRKVAASIPDGVIGFFR
jgi:hypothetical protein